MHRPLPRSQITLKRESEVRRINNKIIKQRKGQKDRYTKDKSKEETTKLQNRN